MELDILNYVQEHPKHKKKLRVRWSDEEFKRALAMWKDGKSAKEIGKVIGRATHSIYAKLKREFFRDHF
jgi:hypothetical protein